MTFCASISSADECTFMVEELIGETKSNCREKYSSAKILDKFTEKVRRMLLLKSKTGRIIKLFRIHFNSYKAYACNVRIAAKFIYTKNKKLLSIIEFTIV